MARFDGSLALRFDFGEPVLTTRLGRVSKNGLRLAPPIATPRGREKYRILEHRRRQAQIKARRLLDVLSE